jgi:SOS-response transcriptional repressor LexA
MEMKEIRRERLRQWFANRTLPEKEKSYLSQLISGKASFGERAARRLERDYGMGEGYLDQPPSAQITVPNTEPGPDIQGRVPLISWVQAGAWTEIIDNLAPGDAEEWLPCPVSHGPSTFALRVRGESMYNPRGRPSFQDGDLIFVDPDRPAVHGSLVVVRLDDDKEATFKRLVVEGDKRYLQALNPAWPEPMIQIDGNATICGVVIFKGERI